MPEGTTALNCSEKNLERERSRSRTFRTREVTQCSWASSETFHRSLSMFYALFCPLSPMMRGMLGASLVGEAREKRSKDRLFRVYWRPMTVSTQTACVTFSFNKVRSRVSCMSPSCSGRNR